ncbi:unnamed protein product [Hydatigera taeniaeformis]|uniref:LRR receptor-like serine/threonine-protein kinase n=1 Tax=Hydatigena taeniaeformis TaxID=6205 RepID=A0A0R3WXV8_HYDTA|nr:unnamed protein product [Hydatigera taeniaeformis]
MVCRGWDQEGLLASLKNLTGLSLSRNCFTVFPSGGPQQFITVQVCAISLSSVCILVLWHDGSNGGGDRISIYSL